jgi:hypothetical protein
VKLLVGKKVLKLENCRFVLQKLTIPLNVFLHQTLAHRIHAEQIFYYKHYLIENV